MPSESVKIVVETQGLKEAAFEMEVLRGHAKDAGWEMKSLTFPNIEGAKQDMQSLSDATEDFVETLEDGQIPSIYEGISDAISKAGLAAASFAGGLAIGQRLGEFIFKTEKWNAALKIANDESNRLLARWEKQKVSTIGKLVDAAGDDVEKLNKLLKGPDIGGAIEAQERQIEGLKKLLPEVAALEATPLIGRGLAVTLGVGHVREDLETLLKEQDVLKAERERIKALIENIPKKKQEEDRKELEKTQAQWGKFFDFVGTKTKNFITEQTQIKPFQNMVKERTQLEKEAAKQVTQDRRDKIKDLKEELRELSRTTTTPTLTGRDDRLGSGRGNPFAAVVAANERLAAERRDQLEQQIDKLTEIAKNTSGTPIRILGP